MTPSGKIEIFAPAIEQKLATAGHGALPIFYTHPEVTGQNAGIEYVDELIRNPVNCPRGWLAVTSSASAVALIDRPDKKRG